MADEVNYPDILGLITGGGRANIGVIQAALATRPRVARAGRPFDVILLMQNASDVDVDVMTTLILPEADARRQRGRFIAKTHKLLVGVAPAEVGYVLLPASTLADTAPSDSYKIEVEIEPRPLHRPQRVRHPDGGGAVHLDLLPTAAQEQIEQLRQLTFSTHKRAIGSRIELTLPLMSGGVGQIADLKPGWVSLATLSDYKDARPLLHRFADTVVIQVLPQLKRNAVYPALLKTTQAKLQAAGYDLNPVEIVFIAKLLTLIVDYASPEENGHGFLGAGRFGIKNLLAGDPLKLSDMPSMPRWFSNFLTLLEREPRVADQPVLVLQRLLYDDLLYDAVLYGFELIERATGDDLGTPAEMEDYAQTLIQDLKAGRAGSVSRLYLPLILGGVLISDQLPVSKETPAELLAQIIRIVEDRFRLADEADRPIYQMAIDLITRTGMKYGFRA
ncbi:MAG: hypothetical protein ACUVS2_03910 [Candidatus Flexifilum sp.]